LIHRLFPKDVQNYCYQYAQDNAGCQREVKRISTALDPDISRKTPQMKPRKYMGIRHQKTHNQQDYTQNNEYPAQRNHETIVEWQTKNDERKIGPENQLLPGES
jgi:hypothetical protein